MSFGHAGGDLHCHDNPKKHEVNIVKWSLFGKV